MQPFYVKILDEDIKNWHPANPTTPLVKALRRETNLTIIGQSAINFCIVAKNDLGELVYLNYSKKLIKVSDHVAYYLPGKYKISPTNKIYYE